jgi:hypothetical protein
MSKMVRGTSFPSPAKGPSETDNVEMWSSMGGSGISGSAHRPEGCIRIEGSKNANTKGERTSVFGGHGHRCPMKVVPAIVLERKVRSLIPPELYDHRVVLSQSRDSEKKGVDSENHCIAVLYHMSE